MNHFVAVDALVGRLEGIERELSQLIGERANVLVELAVEARVRVASLVTAGDLSRRDSEAVSRRAVISDVAAAIHTTENVVTSLMAEAETLVRSFPSTLRRCVRVS